MKKLHFLLLIACTGLALSVTAQLPSYVPTNGLQGWWGFTGNANDYSGNGNHGTPIGAVSLTTDRFMVPNAAYLFSDTGRIALLNCPTTGTGDFTISAWFLTGTYSLTTRKIFINYGSATTNNAILTYIEGGLVHMDLVNTFGPVSTLAVNDSVWHMVTFRNSGGLVQIFIDGLPNGSPVMMSPDIICTNKNIGGNPLMTSFFFGKLDDIGVWNRALTQQEITNLYTGICPPSFSSVVASACKSYTWAQNNQTYTQSGSYHDTLINHLNCDSIITLNLTIINPHFTQQPSNVQANTGSNALFVATASPAGALYRWQISNGGSFHDLLDTGQYAGALTSALTVSNITVNNHQQQYRCIVSQGTCADTSDVAFLTVPDIGMDQLEGAALIAVYPNPAKGHMVLKADFSLLGRGFTISDPSGKVVLAGMIESEQTHIRIENLSEGLYFLNAGERIRHAFMVVKH